MSTETVDPWHAMLSQQVAESAGAHSALDQRRQSASELFQQSGFPTRKHEEWRYTPLKSVAQGEYSALLPADGVLPGDDELATTSDIRIVPAFASKWVPHAMHPKSQSKGWSAALHFSTSSSASPRSVPISSSKSRSA